MIEWLSEDNNYEFITKIGKQHNYTDEQIDQVYYTIQMWKGKV